MTSLFTYSPDELEELQLLFLNYVNRDFSNCRCGCNGFPVNILTIEFNESEIDLDAYAQCPARLERTQLNSYQEFKKDPIYQEFLTEIYPERYGGRRSTKLSNKIKLQQKRQEVSYARELAKENGKTTFQGSSCINGHSGIRRVSNYSCVDCAKFKNSLRDAIERGAFRERLSKKEKLEISKIYQQAQKQSEDSGTEYHVDHIKPLAAGGRHHSSNLQILTAQENLKKGASYKGKSHRYTKKEKNEYMDLKNTKSTSQKQTSIPSEKKGFFRKLFS